MKPINKNIYINEILRKNSFEKEKEYLTLDIKNTNISFDNNNVKKSNDIDFLKNKKRNKSVNTKISGKIFYNLLAQNNQIWKSSYEEYNRKNSIK